MVVRGGPSLDALFADVVKAYQEQHSESQIVSNFSCPPCILYRRGSRRPELDVFVSIGDFEMELLRKEGKTDFQEEVTIGRTPLSLVAPRRMAERVNGLPDLHDEQVKHIGAGDPTNAAVGHYAKAALDESGLWDELEDRFVYKRSGCEIMKLLGLGRELDAAIVFSVCIEEGESKVKHVLQFPEATIPAVPLIVSVTRDSPNRAEAKRFVDFAASDAVKPLLTKHHVLPPAKQ